MPDVTMKYGFDGPISVGGNAISSYGKSINLTAEAEDLDIESAKLLEACVCGKITVEVSFSQKALSSNTGFIVGNVYTLSVSDSVVGTIAGPMICTKASENRENKKVISRDYSFKPAYSNGATCTFSSGGSGVPAPSNAN